MKKKYNQLPLIYIKKAFKLYTMGTCCSTHDRDERFRADYNKHCKAIKEKAFKSYCSERKMEEDRIREEYYIQYYRMLCNAIAQEQKLRRLGSNSDNGPLGCFHGEGNCKMGDGSYKQVQNLQVGDIVMTFHGTPRMITHIMKSKVSSYADISQLRKINDLIITHLHPIYEDGRWIFPKDSKYIDPNATFEYVDYVYSIAIDSPTAQEYGVIIDNIACITLGHNIMDDPILTHDYYGTRRVLYDLDEILRTTPNVDHCRFNVGLGKIVGVI